MSKVKLATLVESDLKTPFSFATTTRCVTGRSPFPGLLHEREREREREREGEIAHYLVKVIPSIPFLGWVGMVVLPLYSGYSQLILKVRLEKYTTTKQFSF